MACIGLTSALCYFNKIRGFDGILFLLLKVDLPVRFESLHVKTIDHVRDKVRYDIMNQFKLYY